MKHLKVAVVVLIGVSFAGCPKSNPTFNLGVENFDEIGPQQRALIIMSDPQIYGREALIDDRRAEVELLSELLDQSKSLQFAPQLRRDLSTVSSFSGEFGVNYDQSAVSTFRDSSQIADLTQQIEATHLQTQLLGLQRELEALKASDAEPTPSESSESEQAGSTPSSNSVTAPEISGVTEQLTAIADRLTTALGAKSSETRQAATSATPRERFRDLSAYRAEVRAALDEVNLDDVHDADGNAMYRLQFRATVMPGAAKNKLGVAQVSIKAPDLGYDDVEELYKTWLAHITYRMNRTPGGQKSDDLYYRTLGYASRLFEVVPVSFPMDSRDKKLCEEEEIPPADRCQSVWLAVPSGFGEATQEFFDESLIPKDEELVQAIPDLLKKYPVHDDNFGWQFVSKKQLTVEQKLSCEQSMKLWEILQVVPSLIASTRGLGARLEAGGESKTMRTLSLNFEKRQAIQSQATIMTIPDSSASVDQRRDGSIPSPLFRFSEACIFAPEFSSRPDLEPFPYEFARQISPNFEDVYFYDQTSVEDQHYVAAGDAYVYSASPVDLAQRISTVSSVADAVQLASALSVVLPGSGIGASAGIGSLNYAVGKAEAIERKSLIVGFSGRAPIENYIDTSRFYENKNLEADSDSPEDDAVEVVSGAEMSKDDLHFGPMFGWVFGPTVVLTPVEDRMDLALRQRLVNHQVSADISVPGWWPSVELSVDSVWIENWFDSAQHDITVISNSKNKQTQSFSVRLPLNRADLDGLTDVLGRKFLGEGLRQTRIDQVFPNTVSVCERDVSFLVYGRDVWRSSEAYLGGARHKSIRVLPDMEGIAVTFDMKGVPDRPANSGTPRMTIWTRNGTDSIDMKFLGGPKTKCSPSKT